ncbi:MAG: hypothetical protein E7441_05820 [Ruminococcaceae bacterium]|nr:hypothetical protein [Oscillospiraceae bacterium]
MEKRIIDAIFSLIRSAITGELLPERENSSLELMRFIDKIYMLASKHDLLPIISFALYKNGLLDKDSETGRKFIDAQMLAVYRFENMRVEFERLCETFEKHKIQFLPLKGSVLREYYPEPWMRTSCDMDVLVKPLDLDKAIEVLEKENGCVFVSKTPHDVTLHSETGVCIELHFELIENGRVAKSTKLLSEIWENAEPIESGKFHMKMSSEMFMFYHVAHMAKHFLTGGCGIRPFVDLWILKKTFALDYEKLNQMMKDCGLVEFNFKCNELCDVWFGAKEHSELTRKMQDYILHAGVYGSFENRITVEKSKGEFKQKRFLQVMFLPYCNLCEIYPILKKIPILFPFYQVVRWFRFFNKKKRNKLITIVSLPKQVSEEKIQSVSELLLELGLTDESTI